jgi:hypothetical protein
VAARGAPEALARTIERQRSAEEIYQLHPVKPTLVPTRDASNECVGVVASKVIDGLESAASHAAALVRVPYLF